MTADTRERSRRIVERSALALVVFASVSYAILFYLVWDQRNTGIQTANATRSLAAQAVAQSKAGLEQSKKNAELVRAQSDISRSLRRTFLLISTGQLCIAYLQTRQQLDRGIIIRGIPRFPNACRDLIKLTKIHGSPFDPGRPHESPTPEPTTRPSATPTRSPTATRTPTRTPSSSEPKPTPTVCVSLPLGSLCPLSQRESGSGAVLAVPVVLLAGLLLFGAALRRRTP